MNEVLGRVLVPRHITLLHGGERTPNTILAHEVVVAAIGRGGRAVYLDSGSNYRSNLVRRLCDKDKQGHLGGLLMSQVMGLDDVERKMERIVTDSEVTVVVLDSLTGALNLSGEPGSKQRQRRLFEALGVLRDCLAGSNIHLLMTDHSSKDPTDGTSRPVGGNVIAHAVDSMVRVDKVDHKKSMMRVVVERSPIVPQPGGVMVIVNHRGVSSIR